MISMVLDLGLLYESQGHISCISVLGLQLLGSETEKSNGVLHPIQPSFTYIEAVSYRMVGETGVPREN